MSLRIKKGIYRKIFLLLIPILVAAGLTASGCGVENSPEGAVRKFFKAWEEGNWKAYKSCIAPEKRKLSKVEDELARMRFEQTKVRFEGIELKVQRSQEDRNKAVVHLRSGKIKYTAVIMGEKKTEVQDIGKMPENERPFFETVRVGGKWYVIIDL